MIETDPDAPDFVSVILPTYNRAHCIGRAIRSVLAQTHANLELIVADDASTDGTGALVEGWGDPRLVHVRQERNRGAAAARNLGLAHARGALIAFQDSDDEWLLDKLERQVAALAAAGPGFGATFGSEIVHGTDAASVHGPRRACLRPDARREVLSGDMAGQMLEGNLITPQALLVTRGAVRAAGDFDTRLPCNNDWEFMIRLSAATRILFTPEPVVVKHVQPDSIHRRTRARALSMLVILKTHEAAFSRHPRARAGWFFRAARLLHALGRHRAATACLVRAIRLRPAWPKPWLGLALHPAERLAAARRGAAS